MGMIITSKSESGILRVWRGRDGWMEVPADRPAFIRWGWEYKTWQVADRAILRLRKAHPSSVTWARAMYCSLEDALQEDNCLGLSWEEKK